MAYWESPNLKDLADKAPKDRAAWEGCVLALLHRSPTEQGMDCVRKVAARAMNQEIKRPPEKHRYAARDWTIVLAIHEAATAAGAKREDLAIACVAVSEVLNGLGVRGAGSRRFTSNAIRAIWRRRAKLPPERFRRTATP